MGLGNKLQRHKEGPRELSREKAEVRLPGMGEWMGWERRRRTPGRESAVLHILYECNHRPGDLLNLASSTYNVLRVLRVGARSRIPLLL